MRTNNHGGGPGVNTRNPTTNTGAEATNDGKNTKNTDDLFQLQIGGSRNCLRVMVCFVSGDLLAGGSLILNFVRSILEFLLLSPAFYYNLFSSSLV